MKLDTLHFYQSWCMCLVIFELILICLDILKRQLKHHRFPTIYIVVASIPFLALHIWYN